MWEGGDDGVVVVVVRDGGIITQADDYGEQAGLIRRDKLSWMTTMCAILARTASRGAAQKSRSAQIRWMATPIPVAINAFAHVAVHWRIVSNNALSVATTYRWRWT